MYICSVLFKSRILITAYKLENPKRHNLKVTQYKVFMVNR